MKTLEIWKYCSDLCFDTNRKLCCALMVEIKEKVHGIVERVTYHNPENGWSVLRVSPFNNPASLETVTVHQTKVFAGATMLFLGAWTHHSQFGRQLLVCLGDAGGANFVLNGQRLPIIARCVDLWLCGRQRCCCFFG